jgi:hypothetical protein
MRDILNKITDCLVYLGAAGAWVLSHFDFIISRGVASATLVFTVLKIIHLVKNWNKKAPINE